MESALAALAVALSCVLLVDSMEHITLLRWARRATWEYLSAALGGDANAVVVVDITPILRPLDNQGRPVTDRAQLRSLVDLVARAEPRAIGIDIDLSPENGEPIDPVDPSMLTSFASLRNTSGSTPIAVRVGVDRTRAHSPEQWLGTSALQGLATTVIADATDNRTMPEAVSFLHGIWLPALGADAARACLGTRELPEPGWPSDLASPYIDHQVGEVVIRSFYVDFSILPQLVDGRLPIAAHERCLRSDELLPTLAEELSRTPNLVKNKLVFLGFADPARMYDNSFAPPGRVRAVPGTFAHAAAAATLLGSGWVYMPSPIFEKLLDLGLAAALIGLIWLVRAKFLQRWSEAEEVSAHVLLTAAAVLLLWLGIGPALTHYMRIIPDGLPIITLSLLVEVLWDPLVVVYHSLRAPHALNS